MDASLAVQGRPTQLSMRYLYEKSKRHDETTGEGTFLETTVYVARQFGAPPEALWPSKPLNRRLPAGVTWSDLDRAAAAYKAQLLQNPDLDGVLAALDKGKPVMVAANVTKAWVSDTATTTGVIGPAGPDEPTQGATVITIVGYDPARQRYRFANNWGSNWGDKGFGTFDGADAKALLQLQHGIWSVTVPPAEP